MSVQENKGRGDILKGLLDGEQAKPQPKRKRGRPKKVPLETIVPNGPEFWGEARSPEEMERITREWLTVDNDLIWTVF